MNLYNIKNIDSFFKLVESCRGKVELVTDEGDRLNLKSKLCQYVAFAELFSNGSVPKMTLIADDPEDKEKLIKFMINGK